MTTMAIAQQTDRPTSNARSIAVFCGSRAGSPRADRLARDVGKLIARAGIRLVYGGGGSGLMGRLSWSAYEHGGDILGVIPSFLYEREREIAAPPQTEWVTDTLGQRKELMLAEADGFAALPGGYGTLDEVLEVVSTGYLGLHRKPLILIGAENEWQPLLAMMDEAVRRGYADRTPTSMLHVVEDAAMAMNLLTGALQAAR
jgi:uncharacterized protein (TIGR00730 family)